MTDRFTDELWRGAADIYDAILAHPPQVSGGGAPPALPPGHPGTAQSRLSG